MGRRTAPTIIHVNQHIIRENVKGEKESGIHYVPKPPLTIKQGYSGKAINAHTAVFTDDSGKEVGKVVYRPWDPLGCGARLWIESKNDVHCQDWNGDVYVTTRVIPGIDSFLYG
jgi:hypothetical protein|tara:strand:+ start:192 stop:533 length:342 start_codon:yes stop_codon:yes gene_type:complete